MRVYHVRGKIPFGVDVLDVDIEIPRSEILTMKRQLRGDGYVFGDCITYDEILRVTSHFAAHLRLRMIPGTWLILLLLKTCFMSVRLGIIAVVILLIMRRWWCAIAILALTYIVNTYLQTFINYELGARLFVLDQHLRELYEEKEPNHCSSGAPYFDSSNDHTPNAYGYTVSESEINDIEKFAEKVAKDYVNENQNNQSYMSDTQKEHIKDFLTTRLKRPERLLIVLYYYEELTMPEIAKVLELPKSEVSKMHSSIITRCRSYLQEKELL